MTKATCDKIAAGLSDALDIARSDSAHKPVITLAELDALDHAEVVAGHVGAEKGDPEPGANHSRAYHHGWRTAQMDLGEIPRPPEHDRLVRGLMDRGRIARGEKPRWPDNMKVTA